MPITAKAICHKCIELCPKYTNDYAYAKRLQFIKTESIRVTRLLTKFHSVIIIIRIQFGHYPTYITHAALLQFSNNYSLLQTRLKQTPNSTVSLFNPQLFTFFNIISNSNAISCATSGIQTFIPEYQLAPGILFYHYHITQIF